MVTFAAPAAHAFPTPPDAPEKPARIVSPEGAIDHALVQRFLAGDETAFVAIMGRHRGKIFAIALNLLRNEADAEEIVQDTFIRAHRGLVNFRGDSSLATWLFRIAVNLSRNRYWYFFRRHRQDALSLDCALSANNAATFSDLVADGQPDPAQETVTKEFTSLVDRSMARLETRHREILVLRNVLNRSYGEIAAALGLNVGTVKSRIARARKNLRAFLAEAFPELGASAAQGDWFLSAHAAHGHGHAAISSP
jgi:RNA polymerase sigma-70 factor (ECF subfamily)